MALALIEAVLAAYREMDLETAQISAGGAFGCPPGCSACCATAEVLTTPLEMLPVAWHLAQRGDFEDWIDRARTAPMRCIFYAPSPDSAAGACSVYPWRPTLCRLFGFASRRGKHGLNELMVCRTVKATSAAAVEKARERVAAGNLAAPCLEDAVRRVAGIDPVLGDRALPINQALAAALEWLWLRWRYGAPPFDIPPDVSDRDRPRAA